MSEQTHVPGQRHLPILYTDLGSSTHQQAHPYYIAERVSLDVLEMIYMAPRGHHEDLHEAWRLTETGLHLPRRLDAAKELLVGLTEHSPNPTTLGRAAMLRECLPLFYQRAGGQSHNRTTSVLLYKRFGHLLAEQVVVGSEAAETILMAICTRIAADANTTYHPQLASPREETVSLKDEEGLTLNHDFYTMNLNRQSKVSLIQAKTASPGRHGPNIVRYAHEILQLRIGSIINEVAHVLNLPARATPVGSSRAQRTQKRIALLAREIIDDGLTERSDTPLLNGVCARIKALINAKRFDAPMPPRFS